MVGIHIPFTLQVEAEVVVLIRADDKDRITGEVDRTHSGRVEIKYLVSAGKNTEVVVLVETPFDVEVFLAAAIFVDHEFGGSVVTRGPFS